MKNFLDQDFLLQTDTARELYHEHAARCPSLITIAIWIPGK